MQKMQDELEFFKQEKRNNIILLSGKTVSDQIQISTDLKSETTELLKKIQDLDTTSLLIKRVTKFGKDSKMLLIEFVNEDFRNKIFKPFLKMNRKPFFISDFLTPHNKNIFDQLKELRQKFPQAIKTAFTRRGQVCYVLFDSLTTVREVRNDTDVKILASKLRARANNGPRNSEDENPRFDNNSVGDNERNTNENGRTMNEIGQNMNEIGQNTNENERNADEREMNVDERGHNLGGS